MPLVRQTEMLARKYDCVAMNPPYLGFKYIKGRLQDFLAQRCPEANKDLYSAFTFLYSDRRTCNYISVMTPFTWMFLIRHADFRNALLDSRQIISLVQLHPAGFDGATVPICTFSLRTKRIPHYSATFVRLHDFPGPDNQSQKTQEAAQDRNVGYRYYRTSEVFESFPNRVLSYWPTERQRTIFATEQPLSSIASARHGMVTSDNDRFLRQWFEVSTEKCFFDARTHEAAENSGKKWFPYNKGGHFRKWSGNRDFLVNWESGGSEVIDYARQLYGSPTRKIQSMSFYFKPCLTWTALSSKGFNVRYCERGFIFDAKGSSIFFDQEGLLLPSLALLNSKTVEKVMEILSPTVDFSANSIESVPFPAAMIQGGRPQKIAESAIDTTKSDWDAYETSWEFTQLPLLCSDHHQPSLSRTYAALRAHWQSMTEEMCRLEEENNRLFIDAYGLADELTPEVPLDEITLTCNLHYRYGGDLSDAEREERLRTDTMRELI